MNKFFITSAINHWFKLLERDDFRNIIIESLKFNISNHRVKLHAYVIMPNHIHLIITVKDKKLLSQFLRDFHKFTAQQILNILVNENSKYLNILRSNRNDRIYMLWKSTHAIKEIYSREFYLQKLEYIHQNPCQQHWQLVKFPEEYLYSSAQTYINGVEGLIPIEVIYD